MSIVFEILRATLVWEHWWNFRTELNCLLQYKLIVLILTESPDLKIEVIGFHKIVKNCHQTWLGEIVVFNTDQNLQ